MLSEIIKGISETDKQAGIEAKQKMDSLVKPLGSLGKLETLFRKLCEVKGCWVRELQRKTTIVMSADNGLCEEVSSAPQAVTAMQTVNFVRGLTGISVLSEFAKASIRVVDIGVKADLDHELIVNEKIAYGTRNFRIEPAMSREEALRAIMVGVKQVEAIKSDVDIIGTGEMGIGNTATSSAIVMAYTNLGALECVGRGAGLDDEGFDKKKRLIEEAIKNNKPDITDPIDVLSKLGGFDIAGLVGVYLACAYYKIPVLIDGFISLVAAFVAFKLNPLSKEYMIPSHKSMEPGYAVVMKEMGLEPALDLDMRLGEGTGGALMFNIIDAAIYTMNNMATFEEAQISDEHLVDIRE